MVRNGPIQLDFARLREVLVQRLKRTPSFVVLEKDFAVVRLHAKFMQHVLSLHQPYRLDELRLLRVVGGSARVTINLIEYEFKAGMLVYVESGAIMQGEWLSDDFQAEGISVDNDLLRLLFATAQPMSFAAGQGQTVLTPTNEENEVVGKMVDALWHFVHLEQTNRPTINHLLAALLAFYDQINARCFKQMHSAQSRERAVFMQFIRLVHLHSKKERKLSFYANELNLSVHYLSALISSESGRTAKDWIERAVTAEAKVLLKHTDLQTCEVSNQLNFPNPAFFCKFFKRLTGLSPQKYRTM